MTAPAIRSYESFLTRPLFSYVLEGEIIPPTDPERHIHSLALLAVATYAKGEKNPSGEEDDIVSYAYSPTWAPEVESTVFCSVDQDNGNQTLVSVSLVSNRIGLDVDETITPGGAQRVTIIEDRQGGGERTYNLGLGGDLYIARLAVSNAAQQFFTDYAA